MPQPDTLHRRTAAMWIGAILLIVGALLLAVECYLLHTGGVIDLPPDALGNRRYLRVSRAAPALMLAIAVAPTVLGAALLIWARRRRSG
ncbi:hypothetical protein [Lysobacter sp. CA199]|uniref:hypothetical protein n=1 Tax=Lysobacter sp. CA199 TaxID=3455608 RepID=UPI003F8CF9E0